MLDSVIGVCLRGCGMRANCYVGKSIGLDQLINVIRSIEEFWPGIVTLPPGGARCTIHPPVFC